MKIQTQQCLTYSLVAALLLLFAGQAAAQSMRTNLSSSIPADDPYCGTNAIDTATIPDTLSPCQDLTLSVGDGASGGDTDFPAGVVDWVLVEVRDAADSAAAAAATAVARKPALLLSNGRVVDAEAFIALSDSEKGTCVSSTAVDGDECPAVSLNTDSFGGNPATIADEAFIVIRHRNHLDIQGANEVTIASNAGSYDFSQAAANTVGGTAGIKSRTSSGNAIFAMFQGDVNGDGLVGSFQDADVGIVGSGLDGNSGYYSADVNMDNLVGAFQDADVGVVGSGNDGSGSQVRP